MRFIILFLVLCLTSGCAYNSFSGVFMRGKNMTVKYGFYALTNVEYFFIGRETNMGKGAAKNNLKSFENYLKAIERNIK